MGGSHPVYGLNSLRDELAPQVHRGVWINRCEAGNKVIFEDTDCLLFGVAAVNVRGNKLEREGVLVEELL